MTSRSKHDMSRINVQVLSYNKRTEISAPSPREVNPSRSLRYANCSRRRPIAHPVAAREPGFVGRGHLAGELSPVNSVSPSLALGPRHRALRVRASRLYVLLPDRLGGRSPLALAGPRRAAAGALIGTETSTSRRERVDSPRHLASLRCHLANVASMVLLVHHLLRKPSFSRSTVDLLGRRGVVDERHRVRPLVLGGRSRGSPSPGVGRETPGRSAVPPKWRIPAWHREHMATQFHRLPLYVISPTARASRPLTRCR